MFLSPGTTSLIQPLDLIWNAACKQKYKLYLSEELWNLGEDDKKFITEGKSVELIIKAYSELGDNVTNASFQKTKLKMFDGNYALDEETLNQAVEEEENERAIFEELEKQVSLKISLKN